MWAPGTHRRAVSAIGGNSHTQCHRARAPDRSPESSSACPPSSHDGGPLNIAAAWAKVLIDTGSRCATDARQSVVPKICPLTHHDLPPAVVDSDGRSGLLMRRICRKSGRWFREILRKLLALRLKSASTGLRKSSLAGLPRPQNIARKSGRLPAAKGDPSIGVRPPVSSSSQYPEILAFPSLPTYKS
jgi:hypothetical protein